MTNPKKTSKKMSKRQIARLLQDVVSDSGNGHLKFQQARLRAQDAELMEEYITTLVCHPEDFTDEPEVVIPIDSKRALLIFEKAVIGRANILYMHYWEGGGELNDTNTLVRLVQEIESEGD